jgi:cell division protein DivIC
MTVDSRGSPPRQPSSVNRQPKIIQLLNFLRHIPSFLRNKYLITSILFVVFILYISENDLFSMFDRNKKLKNLQKSEQHLTKLINDTRQELNLLKTNDQTVEKYAREKYLMKKENEDLFIVEAPINNK